MSEHDHLARLEKLRGLAQFTPTPECEEYAEAIAWAVKTIREVGEQLEHDRSIVADCMTMALKAIDSRHWLTEGRGPYEWDDDKWHEEFYAAAIEIREKLEPLAKVAADWKGCPQSSAEIAKARVDLKKTIREQEARIAELETDKKDLNFRIEAQAATISQLLADIKSNGA